MKVKKGFTTKEYVVFSAEKLVAELVFNMSYHEGNPFTFAEVKTLLDGATVGGHKLSDEQQILRLKQSWDELFRLVESNEFNVSKDIATKLQGIVAENEALEWGVFRSRQVSISGTEYVPPASDHLDDLFDRLVGNTSNTLDTLSTAIDTFLDCAKNQYFFDGNKRTGQLLMNGILLSNAMNIITIPAKYKQQYDSSMLRFYDVGDDTDIRNLLEDCQIEMGKTIKLRE